MPLYATGVLTMPTAICKFFEFAVFEEEEEEEEEEIEGRDSAGL